MDPDFVSGRVCRCSWAGCSCRSRHQKSPRSGRRRECQPTRPHRRLAPVISLTIGFIAGALAAVLMNIDVAKISISTILGIAASGYARTDFIEGTISRVTPTSSAGVARLGATSRSKSVPRAIRRQHSVHPTTFWGEAMPTIFPVTPQAGSVTTTARLDIRTGMPTTSAPVVRRVEVGTVLGIGGVATGETVNGNAQWYAGDSNLLPVGGMQRFSAGPAHRSARGHPRPQAADRPILRCLRRAQCHIRPAGLPRRDRRADHPYACMDRQHIHDERSLPCGDRRSDPAAEQDGLPVLRTRFQAIADAGLSQRLLTSTAQGPPPQGLGQESRDQLAFLGRHHRHQARGIPMGPSLHSSAPSGRTGARAPFCRRGLCMGRILLATLR